MRIEPPTQHNTLLDHANTLRISTETPDPASSQSNVNDFTAQSGLKDVNRDPSFRTFDDTSMSSVPVHKTYEGVCEVIEMHYRRLEKSF